MDISWAWHYDSLWASIGFHSGVIVLNIASRWDHFTPNLRSGSNVEPVAGALSWVLTLGFLGLWQRSRFAALLRGALGRDGGEPRWSRVEYRITLWEILKGAKFLKLETGQPVWAK